MNHGRSGRANQAHRSQVKPTHQRRRAKRLARPASAYRKRGCNTAHRRTPFNAPEIWHEPVSGDEIRFLAEPAGHGFFHPLTLDEIAERIERLPARFLQDLEVIQLSPMTRKRSLFPCYGMQWGPTVYLYPIEESLIETYVRPPSPQQIIEAKMFGGVWTQDGPLWRLEWDEHTIKDFYLNNVLIHEIGHVHDDRNTNFDDRERYANWFAIEYGYRASRGRR
jgi:hypothetical protein